MKFLFNKFMQIIKIFHLNCCDRSIHISAKLNRLSRIDVHSKLYKNVSFRSSKIGSYSYVGWDSILDNVQIGRFSSIAPGVKVLYGRHPVSLYISSSPIFYSTKKQCGIKWESEDLYSENRLIESRSAIIGSDVWIGQEVSLLEGVSIGDGAIVGAGALVTRDVLPYEVVAGVPAKHVKYRFDTNVCDLLNKSKWWDMDLDFIRENRRKFLCNPLDFIEWLADEKSKL